VPVVEVAGVARHPPGQDVSTVQAGVALPATLTLAEARQTAAKMDAALAAAGTGQTLVIDCAGLRTLDSAALSVLLQAQRSACARGQRVHLHEPPPKLRALATLYGVQHLLGLDDPA
jgi:phospholipid transport system transporter-binding protein